MGNRYPHIKIKDSGTFVCEHCGQIYTPALPCPLDMWLAMSRQFIRDHKACPPKQANVETSFSDANKLEV